jgi:DNA-binding response OmpR family regulator
MMRVAIVEDDGYQSAMMARLFAEHGASAEVFSAGRRFLRHACNTTFDVSIIDLRLPDITGLEVLDKLRGIEAASRRAMPAMIVTGHTESSVMQHAFDRGAIDFLIKPFRAEELVIRASSIARRAQPRLFDDAPMQAGRLAINLATMQAFVAGREVSLSARELRLAWLLLQKRGQNVSRAEMLRLVWGHMGSSASRTLDTHIGRIRKKLDLDRSCDIRLRAVYGVGYRMDVFS